MLKVNIATPSPKKWGGGNFIQYTKNLLNKENFETY